MFGGAGGAPGRGFNAGDMALGEQDLDHFLDNYLVGLGNQQQGGMGNPNARMGMPEMGPMAGSLMGQQAGYGGQAFQPQMQQQGAMGGGGQMGMGGGNSLTGIAFLQQQQALLQQQQQQQFGAGQMGMMFGGGQMQGMGLMPQMAGQQGGAAGPSQQHQPRTAPATKGKGAKGKAAATKAAAAAAEPSCSGSDGTGGSDSEEEPRNRKRQATAGGGAVDDAERRHQALQEKNRRAQRRFRERQKTKLQELHKQIDELTTKVSSLQSENASLYSRTNILEKVLDMRNEQIQVMQETKEATGHLEEDLSSMQGVTGHLVQLTPENIKELGSDQIFKIYQLYVKELSVRLPEEGQALEVGGEKLKELEVLVQDLSTMIMRLGVIKPLETRKFIVMSRQYLGSTESEVIELWKNVMKLIDLTEQQKREVVEMKRVFLQKIDPIMEERKQLNMQIQSNLPHDTFATKNALTYIKAHEAVIKLRDNLRSEQHIVLEFAITVFRDVFKPVQMAALLVKCYPAVPDALGIASALAVDLGEPDMPHARQLTMQLGGYLEGSSFIATGQGGGGGNVMGGAPANNMGGQGLGGMGGASGPGSSGDATRGLGGPASASSSMGGMNTMAFGNDQFNARPSVGGPSGLGMGGLGAAGGMGMGGLGGPAGLGGLGGAAGLGGQQGFGAVGGFGLAGLQQGGPSRMPGGFGGSQGSQFS